jgi:hypothetical protein
MLTEQSRLKYSTQHVKTDVQISHAWHKLNTFPIKMLIYTKLPASYPGALNNYNTWSIQAGTHEGVAGKGLHVNSSCVSLFFYKETLGYQAAKNSVCSRACSIYSNPVYSCQAYYPIYIIPKCDILAHEHAHIYQNI